jgi:hypothetical protein
VGKMALHSVFFSILLFCFVLFCIVIFFSLLSELVNLVNDID